MRAGKLDRLFERFRRKGDVRALGEVFDAAAPELYRVAVHLTRDLHQAEDLVQSTFLAAIEARDSYDAERELLPWLLGILTRKSAWERRKLARVIEPDRLPRRSVDQPDAEAETSELSASVTEALEHLPSPYREVLIAHLRSGKSPQEIAFELGRAPGTVRVQLHRGLEMLRKTLPVGLAVGGAMTAFTPHGLAAVRAIVLRSGAHAATSLAAGLAAAPATGWIGGIAVSVKSWVAAGGVLLCLAWFVVHESKSTGSIQPSNEVIAASSPSPLAVEPSSTRTEVEVIAAAEISSQRTSIERVPETPAAVVRAPEQPAAVITSVSGRLLLPDGTPAPDAFVALLRKMKESPRESVTESATSGDGNFLLRADPGAFYLVALADGLLPLTKEIVLDAGTELRLDPIYFSEAAHIRGWVRIAGMPDLSDCKVSAGLSAKGESLNIGKRSLLWSEGRLWARTGSARTDADGRFSLEGLEPQLHQVTVDGASGLRILGGAWSIRAPAYGVELAIDYARVVVHLQCEGSPIEADVRMTAKSGGSTWGVGSGSTAEVLVPPGAGYLVSVIKDGFVSHAIDLVAPAAGETVEREIELEREKHFAQLVIELVALDERKFSQAGFALFRTDQGLRDPNAFGLLSRGRLERFGPGGTFPDIVRDVRESEGTFRLRELPPGRYEVRVQADGTWNDGTGCWYQAPIEVELLPDAVHHRRIDLVLGGRLRIQCRNARGEGLAARCQLIDAGNMEIPIAFFTRVNGSTWGGRGNKLNASAPQGTNEVASNLAPGKYEARFSLEGYVDASRRVTIEPGKTAEISLVLEDR